MPHPLAQDPSLYLMRHFATESGKSKGQFYTPAEVSRVIAKVIGISPENARAATTAYDPTCGSGSLLLKVAAEACKHVTLEGQEKDVTTTGLARMNMILHDFLTENIQSGGDKGFDVADYVEQLRHRKVTPHIAIQDHLTKTGKRRRNRIDGRTTRHPGYGASHRCRKRIKEVFGWVKTSAGLSKTKFRGARRVDASFTLALAAYNLIRLPRLLAEASP